MYLFLNAKLICFKMQNVFAIILEVILADKQLAVDQIVAGEQ